MDVAANEVWNQGCLSQDVCHWADVEAGQRRVAGQVIHHGHASSLHDTARGQIDRLKRAETHQGHLFVLTVVPLGACQAQRTVEEELRASIPYQAIPLNVKVCLDVERFYRVWIVRAAVAQCQQ